MGRNPPLPIWVVAIGVVMAFAGCRQREREPAQRPADDDQPTSITFRSGDRELVFTYVDLSGQFRSVPTVAAIPEASRAVVRVIDPTVRSQQRGDYDLVHVVDLTNASADATYTTKLVGRLTFERRALAALPPGAASRWRLPENLGADAPAIVAHDQIILYGTSWCGACKQARAYFRDRQIPFIEKDVERDLGAAAELAAKAAEAGISADRVPIIDVRGRLLVGFDAARLSTLLGEPI